MNKQKNLHEPLKPYKYPHELSAFSNLMLKLKLAILNKGDYPTIDEINQLEKQIFPILQEAKNDWRKY